ncbi:MAG: 16S rRNA (uracil(1498)-N(3))-methyltransferase [Alphaproteobacteria bacterium]
MKTIYPKKLSRLYVSGLLGEHQDVTLLPEQSHYLLNVLRKKEGDQVLLFNGQQGEWLASLKIQGKKELSGLCETLIRPQSKAPTVWLAFSPLKKHRQDFLIEKTTELGVGTLVPLEMRYTNLLSFNTEKVTKQAIEAAEQCERLTIPDVKSLGGLVAWLKGWPTGRILYVALERQPEDTLEKILEHDKKAAFLVGPEGGFSEEEVDLLSRYPFVKFFSLGEHILRAETAAMMCLGLYSQFRPRQA